MAVKIIDLITRDLDRHFFALLDVFKYKVYNKSQDSRIHLKYLELWHFLPLNNIFLPGAQLNVLCKNQDTETLDNAFNVYVLLYIITFASQFWMRVMFYCSDC